MSHDQAHWGDPQGAERFAVPRRRARAPSVDWPALVQHPVEAVSEAYYNL